MTACRNCAPRPCVPASTPPRADLASGSSREAWARARTSSAPARTTAPMRWIVASSSSFCPARDHALPACMDAELELGTLLPELQSACNPETHYLIVGRRRTGDPSRGTKSLGRIAPRSAAQNARRVRRAGRARARAGRGQVPQAVGLAILDPFPYVAVHIEEPELVRLERSGRRGVGEPVSAGSYGPVRKGDESGLIRAVAVFADAGIVVPE